MEVRLMEKEIKLLPGAVPEKTQGRSLEDFLGEMYRVKPVKKELTPEYMEKVRRRMEQYEAHKREATVLDIESPTGRRGT